MSDVRDIVSRALESGGALVEPIEPDGLEVLTPASLQEALDLPELCRLGFGETLPEGAIRTGLESGWMDTLGEFMAGRGRFLRLGLDGLDSRRQSSQLEEAVRACLHLDNATYRFQEAENCWTEYLALFFHLAAVSDEKREDIVAVCLNQSNGLTADHLVDPLLAHLKVNEPECPGYAGDLPSPWPAEKVQHWMAKFLPARIRASMRPFLAGMERRLSRDLDRLFAYHTDLRREAAERLAKEHAPEDDSGRREAARIEAIEREYRAKVRDLRRKYAMTVEVELLQGVRVALPVARARVNVMRRKGVRPCHLDWNPLSRRLDDLYCESCGAFPGAQLVCDERQHMVCPECMARCSSCGKSYCRACYRDRCPKCGQVRSDT